MTLTDPQFINLVKKNQDNENVKTIEEALSDKANIHSNDNRFGTPLHIAASSGNIPLMELLLNKGANINYNEPPGIFNRKFTPLHHVIDEIIITDREIKYLAPISATGLWTAKTEEGRIKQREETEEKLRKLQGKRVEAVEFLLENGADLKIKNFQGKIPIEETAYNKYDELTNLLMKYAVKDPKYKPSENAHQGIKNAFKLYQGKVVDEEVGKKLGKDPVDNINSFLDGSGKRKSRKLKGKKSKKAKKSRAGKKGVKKCFSRKSKK